MGVGVAGFLGKTHTLGRGWGHLGKTQVNCFKIATPAAIAQTLKMSQALP